MTLRLLLSVEGGLNMMSLRLRLSTRFSSCGLLQMNFQSSPTSFATKAPLSACARFVLLHDEMWVLIAKQTALIYDLRNSPSCNISISILGFEPHSETRVKASRGLKLSTGFSRLVGSSSHQHSLILPAFCLKIHSVRQLLGSKYQILLSTLFQILVVFIQVASLWS